MLLDQQGWLAGALQIASPNCDARPPDTAITLLVIHCISLPPMVFEGPGITSLFTNAIDPSRHDYFQQIEGLRVSAHVVIRREGALVQYVPFASRAWHAGVSSWQGRDRCNDFSIGIELEGTDDSAFSAAQYQTLSRLVSGLVVRYPIADIVGHSEIAPGRKTDPGTVFDWLQLSSSRNVARERLKNKS